MEGEIVNALAHYRGQYYHASIGGDGTISGPLVELKDWVRSIKEAAWEEGYDAAQEEPYIVNATITANPYRESK